MRKTELFRISNCPAVVMTSRRWRASQSVTTDCDVVTDKPDTRARAPCVNTSNYRSS